MTIHAMVAAVGLVLLAAAEAVAVEVGVGVGAAAVEAERALVEAPMFAGCPTLEVAAAEVGSGMVWASGVLEERRKGRHVGGGGKSMTMMVRATVHGACVV